MKVIVSMCLCYSIYIIWLLDRTVESCSIGVVFGQSSFTDLDFADDVSLLAELLELLVETYWRQLQVRQHP